MREDENKALRFSEETLGASSSQPVSTSVKRVTGFQLGRGRYSDPLEGRGGEPVVQGSQMAEAKGPFLTLCSPIPQADLFWPSSL